MSSQSKAPPQQLRIKRPRDETPVESLYLETLSPTTAAALDTTSKKRKTSPSPPTYVFRLARAGSGTFQPSIGSFKPPKVVDTSTEDNDAPIHNLKRKAPPTVRKYTLTKRARMHPYARGGAATFERIVSISGSEASAVEQQHRQEQRKQKRPLTHPKEKEANAARKKEVKGLTKEEEEMQRQMEELVLEYLDEETNRGIQAVNSMDAEREDFVYDVYIREELRPGETGRNEGEDYGLLVFEDKEDEQWWWEAGEDDPESDPDPNDENDEDSNAEDFYTHDYPDELSDDESDFVDEEEEVAGRYPWQRKKTLPGEEEYDLENDYLDDEEDDDGVRRLEKEIRS